MYNEMDNVEKVQHWQLVCDQLLASRHKILHPMVIEGKKSCKSLDFSFLETEMMDRRSLLGARTGMAAQKGGKKKKKKKKKGLFKKVKKGFKKVKNKVKKAVKKASKGLKKVALAPMKAAGKAILGKKKNGANREKVQRCQ